MLLLKTEDTLSVLLPHEFIFPIRGDEAYGMLGFKLAQFDTLMELAIVNRYRCLPSGTAVRDREQDIDTHQQCQTAYLINITHKTLCIYNKT